jgi:hypothetical protein
LIPFSTPLFFGWEVPFIASATQKSFGIFYLQESW